MTLHMTISSFQKQLTTQITDFLATKVISESSKQAYAYDLKQFTTLISGQIDQTTLKLYENQLKEWKPSVQKRKRSAVSYTDRDKWSDQNINFGFLRYCFSDFGSEDGNK